MGYVASVTLFYHGHTINGERVVHSHPYSEEPDTGNHRHTCAEVETIAHLTQLLMVVASLYVLKRAISFLTGKIEHHYNTPLLSLEKGLFYLRAPPAGEPLLFVGA